MQNPLVILFAYIVTQSNSNLYYLTRDELLSQACNACVAQALQIQTGYTITGEEMNAYYESD